MKSSITKRSKRSLIFNLSWENIHVQSNELPSLVQTKSPLPFQKHKEPHKFKNEDLIGEIGEYIEEFRDDKCYN